MNKKIVFILLSFFFQLTYAQPIPVELSVWVNEAIVATYTYSYKNYLEDQKKIARYFTAGGWMAYNKALIDSKLPEAVQKNLYFVSSVATEPPVITEVGPNHWNASMNTLVMYKNPQYQQKQTLKVTIDFMAAPPGQGVRGYNINSLQAKIIKAPCKCAVQEELPEPPAPPEQKTKPNDAKP